MAALLAFFDDGLPRWLQNALAVLALTAALAVSVRLLDLTLVGPSVLVALGGLALAGLPPFGLFRGEALMEPAERAMTGWLSTVAILASALTGGAVLRVAAHVFAGIGSPDGTTAGAPKQPNEQPETTGTSQRRMPWNMGAVVTMSLLLAAASGVLSPLAQGAATAAVQFRSFEGYSAAVLGTNENASKAVPPHPRELDGGAFIRSGIGVALACAFAALALWPSKRRGFLSKSLAALYRLLGRLHSGLLGDYVAWLLLGVAGYAGALFLLGGLGH